MVFYKSETRSTPRSPQKNQEIGFPQAKAPHVYCLGCERISIRGKNCETCGKPLPGLGDPPVKMANKIDVVRRQTLLYRSGDLSRPEYVAWLDKEEDVAWEILEATEEKKISEDMRPVMGDELKAGRKGVATYLQALEALREWLDGGGSDLMQTAFALTTNADNLMDQALKMNWNSYRDLIEATREFLRQSGYRP